MRGGARYVMDDKCEVGGFCGGRGAAGRGWGIWARVAVWPGETTLVSGGSLAARAWMRGRDGH